MHPQAIIVDGTNNEEAYFTRGLKQHLKVSKTSLIELPRFSPKSLDWITKLDNAALRSKTISITSLTHRGIANGSQCGIISKLTF